jgi:AAA domain
MSAITFSAHGGLFSCEWGEPDHIVIEFDRLQTERSGDITADVAVRMTAPGLVRNLHSARLLMTGTRARGDLAKHLAERTKGHGLDWSEMVEEAIICTLDTYRAGDPPILLRDAVAPEGERWLLPPLVLATQPTIWFGDGGVGKSALALAAGLSIHMDRGDLLGVAPTAKRVVAYFDWEFDAYEHRERMRQLVGGQMPDIVYRRCQVPLRDDVERLNRYIRDWGIDFLIIDSVGAACGDEPESAAVALAFFNALRQLGCGALCIAHTTKNGSEERPFGSTFWHNGARSTWLVKKERDTSASGFVAGMFNKKSNSGPLASPIGFGFDFSDDRLVISRTDIRDVVGFEPHIPLRERMRAALRSGAASIKDLAAVLGEPEGSLRKTVDRDKGRTFVRLEGDGDPLRVGLVDHGR